MLIALLLCTPLDKILKENILCFRHWGHRGELNQTLQSRVMHELPNRVIGMKLWYIAYCHQRRCPRPCSSSRTDTTGPSGVAEPLGRPARLREQAEFYYLKTDLHRYTLIPHPALSIFEVCWARHPT